MGINQHIDAGKSKTCAEDILTMAQSFLCTAILLLQHIQPTFRSFGEQFSDYELMHLLLVLSHY
jgi:hypothetical protein